MKCKDIKPLLHAWIDEDGALASPLAEHLKQCTNCAVEAKRLSTARDALRELPSLDLPDGFDARFFARLEVEKEKSKRWSRKLTEFLSPFFGRPIPAMAALMVMAALFVTSFHLVREREAANMVEIVAMDLDLYENLDLLDELEDLEAMEGLL